MQPLDLEDSIVDWATEYPHAIPIFEKHQIEYCCAGKSLAYACQVKGVDPHRIMEEIGQALARRNDTESR